MLLIMKANTMNPDQTRGGSRVSAGGLDIKGGLFC